MGGFFGGTSGNSVKIATAHVTGTTGAIDTGTFNQGIATVVRNSTGQYTVNYSPGFFSVPPTLFASTVGTGYAMQVLPGDATTSDCNWFVPGTGYLDVDFFFLAIGQ